MPTLDQLDKDPDFQALSAQEKRLFVGRMIGQDPDFQSMNGQEQSQFLNRAYARYPDAAPIHPSMRAEIPNPPRLQPTQQPPAPETGAFLPLAPQEQQAFDQMGVKPDQYGAAHHQYVNYQILQDAYHRYADTDPLRQKLAYALLQKNPFFQARKAALGQQNAQQITQLRGQTGNLSDALYGLFDKIQQEKNPQKRQQYQQQLNANPEWQANQKALVEEWNQRTGATSMVGALLNPFTGYNADAAIPELTEAGYNPLIQAGAEMLQGMTTPKGILLAGATGAAGAAAPALKPLLGAGWSGYTAGLFNQSMNDKKTYDQNPGLYWARLGVLAAATVAAGKGTLGEAREMAAGQRVDAVLDNMQDRGDLDPEQREALKAGILKAVAQKGPGNAIPEILKLVRQAKPTGKTVELNPQAEMQQAEARAAAQETPPQAEPQAVGTVPPSPQEVSSSPQKPVVRITGEQQRQQQGQTNVTPRTPVEDAGTPQPAPTAPTVDTQSTGGVPVQTPPLPTHEPATSTASTAEKGRVTNAEVQPVAQATPQEQVAEPDILHGTKNAVTAEMRQKLGLDELPTAERKAQETSLAQGKAAVDSGQVEPIALAESVLQKPRPLNDIEQSVLNYHGAQLQMKYDENRAALADATLKGDQPKIDQLQAAQETYREQYDTVSQALKRTGSEIGRALSMRQKNIGQDYSVLALRQERIAAKGGPLSAAEEEQIENFSNRYQELQRQYDEAQKAQEEVKSQTAAADTMQQMKTQVARQQRASQRAMTRADLDAELAELFNQWKGTEQASEVSAGIPLTPEKVGILRKIALNYVKRGVATMEGVVNETYNRIKESAPGLTVRDVRDAISGYGVKKASRQLSAAQQRLSDLQTQMRLTSQLEDLQSGKTPQKGSAISKGSPEVQDLRRQLAELEKKTGIGAKPLTPSQEFEQAIVRRIGRQGANKFLPEIQKNQKVYSALVQGDLTKLTPADRSAVQALIDQHTPDRQPGTPSIASQTLNEIAKEQRDIATAKRQQARQAQLAQEREQRAQQLEQEKIQREQTAALPENQFARRMQGSLTKPVADKFIQQLKDEGIHDSLISQTATDLQMRRAAALYEQARTQRPVKTTQPLDVATQSLRTAVDEARKAERQRVAALPENVFDRNMADALGRKGADAFQQQLKDAGIYDPILKGTATEQQVNDAARLYESQRHARPTGTPQAQSPATQAIRDAVEAQRKAAREAEAASKGPSSKVDPNEYFKGYRKRIQNEIDRLNAKIAAGDYTPETKTPSRPLDAHTQQLRDQLDALKLRIAMENEKAKGIPFLSQLNAVRTAGLLSSPRTIAKVLVAHGVHLTMEEAAKIPASIMDAAISKIPGNQGRRTVGMPNAGDVAKAAFKGATQGVAEGVQILRRGEKSVKPLGENVIDQDQIHSRNKMLNTYINTIGRSHSAAYRPFKLFAFDRAIQEQARLQARAEGKGPQRVQELMDNPTNFMIANAMQSADEATFLNQNELNKAITAGKGVMKKGGALHAVVQYELPITKVPTNIVAKAGEYSGLNFVFRELGPALKARGVMDAAAQRRFSMTFGRASVGAGILALGAYLYSKGVLTGYGKQKDGRDPATLYAGGRAYHLDAMMPHGGMLAVGASLAQHGLMGGVYGGVGVAGELPYTRLSEQIAELKEPNKLNAVLGGEVGSLVPQGVADVAGQMDKVARNPQSWGDYVRERIPWVRQGVREQVGRKRAQPNSLFDPLRSVPAR